MTLARRIIPCLDVKDGRVVKGINFIALRDAGDPVEQAAAYDAQGADEICYLDISASPEGRSTLVDVVARTADQVFTPLTVGGGVRSIADAERLLEAGAERVVVGTAAFADEDALDDFARAIGEPLVVAVDVRDDLVAVGGWTETTTVTVDEALSRCRAAGVPRLLCTAIDRDGTLAGPDVELLERVCADAGAPVLAAGGVRSLDDVAAIQAAGCEGAVVGRALLEGRLPLATLAGAWTDAAP